MPTRRHVLLQVGPYRSQYQRTHHNLRQKSHPEVCDKKADFFIFYSKFLATQNKQVLV